MFTETELEALTQRIVDLYEPVHMKYLTKIGEHIRDIGRLKQSDIDRLKEIQRMRGNAREIAEELSIVSGKSIDEIEALFTEIAKEQYSFAEQFYTAKGLKQIAFEDNNCLRRIVKSEARRTANSLKNLSRTTASQLKRNPNGYRDMVDYAVRSVTSGMTDYNSAIRRVIRQAVSEKISVVQFDTGYRRRVDSQVRMNVLEGIRQVFMGVNEQCGKEFGADGVEISVHGLCAEDHLPIQGKQFSLNGDVTINGKHYPDYNRMNNSLKRPIGTLNCKHYTLQILLGISSPVYSENELKKINNSSLERIEIDGRTLTRYEWSQAQRRIETAVRRQKDVAVVAAACEDMPLRREVQVKINKLNERYALISEKTGIDPRKERMAVSGFRRVKTEDELTLTRNRGIISKNTTNEVQDVHYIGKINREIYKCVTEDIQTDEVIITDERIQHIIDRHPNDYEKYCEYLRKIVEEPEYIIEANKVHSALILKSFSDGDVQFKTILRLVTPFDNPAFKNSIITFMKIDDKEWERLLRNKKILYKSE